MLANTNVHLFHTTSPDGCCGMKRYWFCISKKVTERDEDEVKPPFLLLIYLYIECIGADLREHSLIRCVYLVFTSHPICLSDLRDACIILCINL